MIDKQTLDEIFDEQRRIRKSLMMSVKLDHEEVCKVVVRDLISKRNSDTNKIRDSFDAVLRYYIDESEFKKYVINKEEIL